VSVPFLVSDETSDKDGFYKNKTVDIIAIRTSRSSSNHMNSSQVDER
jgi:hypothetical protein